MRGGCWVKESRLQPCQLPTAAFYRQSKGRGWPRIMPARVSAQWADVNIRRNLPQLSQTELNFMTQSKNLRFCYSA